MHRYEKPMSVVRSPANLWQKCVDSDDALRVSVLTVFHTLFDNNKFTSISLIPAFARNGIRG